jgi:hypothetical protein
MQMQDYDTVIIRLKDIVRRAKTYDHSREDLMMRIEFFVEDLQLEQSFEEERMIKGMMAA